MKYPSLREFIDRLDFENELVRIQEPVSPVLEIAEITDRISKQPGGGKALLFEKVEGSSMPVLINAFGSKKRMDAALGTHDVEEIAKRIERYLKIQPPVTLLDKAKLLPMLLEAARFPPKLIGGSKAPCQEVVHLNNDVDLNQIPILQCWPSDAGRFITFPIVINRSMDRKVKNVGLYRMQVYDSKTTAIHWHIHKDGAHFFHEYRKQNKVMEVAVAIGADPASCYAASAPLPYGIDEFLLSGFIRKQSVPLVKCKTVELEVPANAEIVLEGFIDPSEMRLEGPFGDHTGYYSQDGDYPVFHLTAITHRKDPIYLTTIVGKPPQEDYYLGRATERIFLPLLRTQLPEIIDMDMPVEGVFHNCVIVSLEKRFPMQSRRLMSALWGLGQMSFVKTIIAVDAAVDVHNYKEIIKLLLNKVSFEHDLFFSEGVLDVLNHASDHMLYGSKLGIDLTEKMEGEPGFGENILAESNNSPAPSIEEVRNHFSELADGRVFDINARRSVMVASLNQTRPHQTKEFIEAFFSESKFSGINILIVVEGHVDIENDSTVMWKFFNNLDPKRDFHFKGNRLGVDATKKFKEEGYQQNWPEEIEMSEEIKERVDTKWDSMFDK
ncbi:MAG: menaquinone biosynthesis decarboxylase [Nitrospinae bacterium]|nr:menaquinone biosynthesis decarboxylase [Nitrospinota bacterium]